MKKLSYFIILIMFCACGKTPNEAKITGEITGLTSDTIFVFGADELSDIRDTIYLHNNQISDVLPADTLFQVMLVMGNGLEYPLYLDKGKKITIHGNLENQEFLDIRGSQPNDELTAFNRSLLAFENMPDSITAAVEEFIRVHQTSLASIYLLDKYFVQQPDPDLDRIRRLISYMDGTLQDKPYIERLSARLVEAEKAEPGKTALSFSLPNAKGESITRTKYRNKYLLLNFWASWCDSCSHTNAELRKIYRKYKNNEEFAILGISLDIDRQEWRQTIADDTLAWEQVCDFSGLENKVAAQYGVYSIPYNILLGKDGRVLERDIRGEKLEARLEELLKKEKK